MHIFGSFYLFCFEICRFWIFIAKKQLRGIEKSCSIIFALILKPMQDKNFHAIKYYFAKNYQNDSINPFHYFFIFIIIWKYWLLIEDNIFSSYVVTQFACFKTTIEKKWNVVYYPYRLLKQKKNKQMEYYNISVVVACRF